SMAFFQSLRLMSSTAEAILSLSASFLGRVRLPSPYSFLAEVTGGVLGSSFPMGGSGGRVGPPFWALAGGTVAIPITAARTVRIAMARLELHDIGVLPPEG